ncbi:MAG: hypothetical protein ABGZ17_20240 [Planctomycetaceae bacterium]
MTVGRGPGVKPVVVDEFVEFLFWSLKSNLEGQRIVSGVVISDWER